MTQPAKAQEPSMEEILASIRRIIADEEAVKPQTRAAPEPTPGRAAGGSESPGASEPAAHRAPAQAGGRALAHDRSPGAFALGGGDRRGQFRVRHACAYRAGAECAHARGPRQGNAAPDAENLARRQSPESGRAAGPGRDRARVPQSAEPADGFGILASSAGR